jgi:hypothetical protein
MRLTVIASRHPAISKQLRTVRVIGPPAFQTSIKLVVILVPSWLLHVALLRMLRYLPWQFNILCASYLDLHQHFFHQDADRIGKRSHARLSDVPAMPKYKQRRSFQQPSRFCHSAPT